ncbi:MAG: 16S rRNA (cytidine(1402)-2'-O)-methyltransferase [Chloroflexota bacterium]|nr:16S rRNA (cytidine(1402)-2'-O)-methyltransferase [Chloroflexota bacterium]MDE2941496.1 16S rRNA (cytidine(1402)-2'-O)-methyltransferase [Chloroflexota bacterium]MDE3266874.1 16S rRNA (cytidine(1402)-2'-O)-methyltransferase [Chloroflexota bacterium]
MPTLYVVATPIGNLEDITLRALRILREVDLIASEDTRTTRRLLSRYDIHTPLTSYNEHNSDRKLPTILAALADGDVALVSDAGTPGISDPGLHLVRAAADEGVEVVSIPGPSAVVTALAVSGMQADRFLFLGFLPRRRADRRRLLVSMSRLPYTFVTFETPHRLRDSLADMLDTLGDRSITALREATKLHEETFRGAISDCLAHFQEPRGEFTLVVEGGRPNATPPPTADGEAMLRAMLRDGVPAREARERAAAESGLPRREVYRLWLSVRREA